MYWNDFSLIKKLVVKSGFGWFENYFYQNTLQIWFMDFQIRFQLYRRPNSIGIFLPIQVGILS